MTPLTVALIVFVALAAAAMAIGLAVRDLRAVRAAPPPRLQRLKPAAYSQAPPGAVNSFDQWFSRLVQDAGWEIHPTLAAAAILLWAVVCGAALYIFDERVGPAVAVGLVAGAIPLVYLMIVRARRLSTLEEQLPPALETLARSMRAGQTIDQAIRLVGDHSPHPLAKEFRWCANQLDMGLALPAVMRSFIQRVRLYDVRIFATTLIVHRQTGGNVVEVLERLAQVIRERLAYRRQLRAATATGRLSAGTVSLVAPAVFLYYMFFQPDHVQTMLHSPLGQSILVIILILEVVGVVWTMRVLRPAY